MDTSRTCHRWLHGDAHPGNLLRANGEWVWADFEECVFGPVEWDLACLRGSRRVDGAAAVRAYGAEDSESVNPGNAGKARKSGICGELRQLQAAAWLSVLAERFPERGRRARQALDALA